ncbi:atp-dependent dna helicase [Lasius niger]|uniref:Atp-dependent dna helicase n=1 Tax=Lasius niger TaxID=67767 RepID=A0A0J7MV75_LASNI|nr:atp-dependent dna helicase [Lasius niger]
MQGGVLWRLVSERISNTWLEDLASSGHTCYLEEWLRMVQGYRVRPCRRLILVCRYVLVTPLCSPAADAWCSLWRFASAGGVEVNP